MKLIKSFFKRNKTREMEGKNFFFRASQRLESVFTVADARVKLKRLYPTIEGDKIKKSE